MATYRISGIWKDANGVITHYAMHNEVDSGTTRASRIPKAQAITIVEGIGNHATTWLWNYSQARWSIGETVQVVNGPNGKYLRSNPDNKLTDNLAHLINYDWIFS